MNFIKKFNVVFLDRRSGKLIWNLLLQIFLVLVFMFKHFLSVEKFTMLGMDGDATAAAPSGDMDDVQEEVEGEEQEEQLDEINRSSSKGSKSELNVKSDPDLKSEIKKNP